MALKAGDTAPDFTLPTTAGGEVTLSKLRGKKVVLYFYPKDQTPGCTREACDFRDHHDVFGGSNAVVLGVSRDTIASHQRFREKERLPFHLLSDPDSKVATSYGAYGEKLLYGKPTIGTIRSTFVIDEGGRIAAAWSPVKVDGHAAAVLQAMGATVSRPTLRKATAPPAPPKKARPAAKPAAKATTKATASRAGAQRPASAARPKKAAKPAARAKAKPKAPARRTRAKAGARARRS